DVAVDTAGSLQRGGAARERPGMRLGLARGIESDKAERTVERAQQTVASRRAEPRRAQHFALAFGVELPQFGLERRGEPEQFHSVRRGGLDRAWCGRGAGALGVAIDHHQCGLAREQPETRKYGELLRGHVERAQRLALFQPLDAAL